MEDALRNERWYLDPKNHAEAVAIAARISKSPASKWDSWFLKKDGERGDYYHDPDGKPDLKALQGNVDAQHELGFIKSAFDVARYADLSLVEEAAKRFGLILQSGSGVGVTRSRVISRARRRRSFHVPATASSSSS